MADTAESTFVAQVIVPFRATVAGRALPLDYAAYMALPVVQRTGDEAAVVDALFTRRVLGWLGFDIDAGHATYNRNRQGEIVTRPDYIAHGPSGQTAITWEDKATTEEFSAEHSEQLRRYLAGRTGYAVWCNARRILAFRFEASGQPTTIADISIDALFGPSPAAESVRRKNLTDLVLLRILLNRERFFQFDALVAKVAVDEATFVAQATPLDSDEAQHEFISGSRGVLEQLRLAALAQINSATATSDRRTVQDSTLAAEWSAASADLVERIAIDLKSVVIARLSELERRLGVLHADDLAAVERAAAGVRGRSLPPVLRQLFIVWAERAARINSAARGTRLLDAEDVRISESFTIWRERQPDSSLATPEIFAEQVGYVFFVRLLLTRILEDKGLLPSRIASNGGFKAWTELIRTYFGDPIVSMHSDSFMRILSDRVSMFYQHFFRQPLFDWFLPDDYLLLQALGFLSNYSFSTIGSDLLGFTYEEYIERIARGKKGHFLTRPAVVDYMLDILEYHGPEIIGRRILDPACGSGSFLVHAARRLREALIESLCRLHRVPRETMLATPAYRLELASEYVYSVTTQFVGMEIDPFAYYLAELNLLIQCLDDLHVLWQSNHSSATISTFRIFNTDSLDLPEPLRNVTLNAAQPTFTGFSASLSGAIIDPAYNIKLRDGDSLQGFYYIICNPPYVNSRQEQILMDYRKIPFYAEALSGDFNLYLLFIRLGLYYLASSGRMVYVVPLTIVGDDSARSVRYLLTHGSWHPDRLVRFYTGNVLFPGVDQAVAIFRVIETLAPPLEIEIAGGRTVNDVREGAVITTSDAVLSTGMPTGQWNGAWLVSPDPDAYDIWNHARAVMHGQMADIWSTSFDVAQGDLNATHINPLRVERPVASDLPVYKGEDIARFAPLPRQPSAWVRPTAAGGLTATSRRANEVSRSILHLPYDQSGFVIRQVARLNTRDELKATWFDRSPSRLFAFTNEVWRFLLKEKGAVDHGKVVFGILSSRVVCYLLNLFNTNNHISIGELGRLPVPDIGTLDTNAIKSLVDNLLSLRANLRDEFSRYGVRLPDVDTGLGIAPEAVLTQSPMPAVSLSTLILRGEIIFSGTEGTRLARATPRYLSARDGSSLADVLPLFVSAYSNLRWSEALRVVELPEPSLATNWLAEYRRIVHELEDAWARFEQLKRDLDTAIGEWYGFNEQQMAAIARGLPWTHA